MEKISSRKNQYIARLRALAADGNLRRETGETVLDGEKLLLEALTGGIAVTSVLWSGEPKMPLPANILQYTAPRELVEYASPVKSSPGPVFTLRLPRLPLPTRPSRVLVLENVQDPGNVGTVIRAAAALGVAAVVLCGDCADPWSPRTARAAMGASFRLPVAETDIAGLAAMLASWGLPLYGAALSKTAEDIRAVQLSRSAVAIGNEGRGLSAELLELCEKKLIIPMTPGSESLNAAMAATLVIWEMVR
ncbi:MAG: RNA methyltransferase [Oscillospiraceae bacterium]